jgi:hypothetical protein
MDAPLTLTASTAGDRFAVAAPIPVRLALTNQSANPVWINGRLGVGYPDGLCREIFFTVRDDAGRVLPVPDAVRVDAHRLPPTQLDFVQLRPRQAVTGQLDLALWCPFEQPGSFSVEFHYQNSDDGSAFGLAAFTGRVDAGGIRLQILP